MSNSVTTQGENPVAKFSKFLDQFKPQMTLALPKHLNADRMARLALTQFSSTPKLQECEPRSIAASIITASTLGLEIGVNGQGYLVPYFDFKKKITICQFIPGWKGLVDIANRSGQCTVWTGAVFQGDEFDYALGDRPFIHHKPGDEDDPNKLLYVYAVGRRNGSEWPVIEVWRMSKIWRHRDDFNKVGKGHYSYKNPEMYARKVPLLQVLKYMPASIELSNAIAAANAAENGRAPTIDVGTNFVTVSDPGDDYDDRDDDDNRPDADGVIDEPTSKRPNGNGGASAKPALSDEALDARKGVLTTALNAGQAVNDVIAALETKNSLTLDQKMTVASWAPKNTTHQEAAQ